MAETFGHHPWTVQDLVSGVSSGQVRLPDIQRPFVWANAKVRNLVDSMYRGFPVGELMFWENTGEIHSRPIGVGEKTQGASMQVIDGQQRLTSLYAVVRGASVLRGDYSQETITIAFHPLTERFAVPDNAVRRSSEWIHDIRDVFESPIAARKNYLRALEEARDGQRLDDETESTIENALNRLNQMLNYEFQVVQLKKSVSRETIADIFVRINSEGVKLSSTDYILTWLSVFWEQGREQLEEFAKASRFTSEEMRRIFDQKVMWTPKNAFVDLDPGHILRVVVAVGNKRAQLQDAYNALRGRHPRTREIIPEERERQLALLQNGQERVLNPTHWDEYLKVIERAGFRTRSMITSKNTILFGYALWLLGRTEFGVPIDDLRETMARWHFMAHITARYSGSAETRGQEDIKRIDELDRTPEAFIASIDSQIATNLTEDWWQVTLPEELHTSSMSGPAYTGYLAALNILDAEVLLSTLRVKDWLDPSRRPVKGAEKHHLFPKDYLKEALGYSSVRQINQVANQALVEWSDNIDISNHPPSTYWPGQVADKDIGADRVAQQMRWHGLPDNWTSMSYEIFLDKRRHLIAEVTHEGFKKLSNPNYQPSSSPSVPPPEPVQATFEHLVRENIVPVGTRLTPTEGETDSIAEVGEDGTILLGDEEYFSPDFAAKADGAHDSDGWSYWTAHLAEPATLEELILKIED